MNGSLMKFCAAIGRGLTKSVSMLLDIHILDDFLSLRLKRWKHYFWRKFEISVCF